jgi:hypothetical protein
VVITLSLGFAFLIAVSLIVVPVQLPTIVAILVVIPATMLTAALVPAARTSSTARLAVTQLLAPLARLVTTLTVERVCPNVALGNAALVPLPITVTPAPPASISMTGNVALVAILMVVALAAIAPLVPVAKTAIIPMALAVVIRIVIFPTVSIARDLIFAILVAIIFTLTGQTTLVRLAAIRWITVLPAPMMPPVIPALLAIT